MLGYSPFAPDGRALARPLPGRESETRTLSGAVCVTAPRRLARLFDNSDLHAD